jgi:hypothetical protein
VKVTVARTVTFSGASAPAVTVTIPSNVPGVVNNAGFTETLKVPGTAAVADPDTADNVIHGADFVTVYATAAAAEFRTSTRCAAPAATPSCTANATVEVLTLSPGAASSFRYCENEGNPAENLPYPDRPAMSQ